MVSIAEDIPGWVILSTVVATVACIAIALFTVAMRDVWDGVAIMGLFLLLYGLAGWRLNGLIEAGLAGIGPSGAGPLAAETRLVATLAAVLLMMAAASATVLAAHRLRRATRTPERSPRG